MELEGSRVWIRSVERKRRAVHLRGSDLVRLWSHYSYPAFCIPIKQHITSAFGCFRKKRSDKTKKRRKIFGKIAPNRTRKAALTNRRVRRASHPSLVALHSFSRLLLLLFHRRLSARRRFPVDGATFHVITHSLPFADFFSLCLKPSVSSPSSPETTTQVSILL